MSVNVGSIHVLAELRDKLTPQLKKIQAASVAAAGAMGVLAKRGSEVERIATSFDRLTIAAGQSGDAIVSKAQTATRGLISELNIMEAANKALLLGLDVNEKSMADMAGAAVTLGQAMGQGPNKSLDDLITALGRSSPLILDNLGLTVKVGEANKAYAAELGKTVTQLTEAEKKQAFFNAAMDAAREKTAELGGVQVTAADQYIQLKTAATDWFDSVARGTAKAVPQFGIIGGAISDIGSSFNALGPAWLSVAPMVKSAANVMKASLRGVRLSSIAMWGSLTSGITVILPLLWAFRKQIGDVLANVILDVAAWADKMLVAFEKATGWIPGFDSDMSRTRDAIAETAKTVSGWADGLGEAEGAVEEVSTVVATEYTPAVEAAEKATLDWSVSVERAIPAFREIEKPVKDLREHLRGGLNTDLLGTAEAMLEIRDNTYETPGIITRIKDGLVLAKDELSKFGNIGTLVTGIVSGGLTKLGEMAAGWVVEKFKAMAGKVGGFIKGLFTDEDAERLKQTIEGVMDSAISAYERAMAAGQNAYAQVLAAALESGAGEQEAIRMALAAQKEKALEILRLEGETLARRAAFEAALAEIQAGNAAGAAAAARKAAEQTIQAWGIALGQVAEAANIAGQAVQNIPSSVDINVHTSYTSSGTPPQTGVPGAPPPPDPGTVPGETNFNRGSGGVRDFGRGTPAVLHGREAVMTQQQIERLIAAAASGGGGGDIVVQVDRREIGRVAMSEIRRQAQGRAY